MINKIDKYLFSEKGMTIVNILFFLSLFFRNSGVIFVAYIVWILYLINCIKKANSQTAKITYSVFIVFASVMIVLNLYLLVKAL